VEIYIFCKKDWIHNKRQEKSGITGSTSYPVYNLI